MKQILLILAVVLLLAPVLQAAPAAPQDLAAKEVDNLLGLALHEHALSWKVNGQVGYQALVASDLQKLGADVGNLWNSGMRHSAARVAIKA